MNILIFGFVRHDLVCWCVVLDMMGDLCQFGSVSTDEWDCTNLIEFGGR